MGFPILGERLGNKGAAKFAIYVLILSALAVYSIFFAKELVYAISYYPVAGNLCKYQSSSANDCTTNSSTYLCSSGTYRPSFTCQATNPTCTAETASVSCNGACTDCNGAGACVSKTCVAGNNYGCASGSYCNATPSCVSTAANGQSCSCSGSPLNGACTSGNCGNGGASVCCDAGYQCCSVDGDCAANTFCSSNDCKFAYPQWSTNVTSLTSPYTGPSSLSSFNVTWTQANFSVSVVFFESNYTGTATNYTMTQLATNMYNYNITLGAGTYYWKSWANSSKNTWNNTPQFIITISKGTLSGTIAGASVTYPNAVNVVPTRSTAGGDTDVTYVFWRNTSVNGGTQVSSAVAASPTADTSLLGAGTYSWILNSTGGANWTSSSSIAIQAYTVSKGTLSGISITGASVTYPNAVSVSASGTSSNEDDIDVAYNFYRNSSATNAALVSTATDANPSSDTTLLGVGTYSWFWNSTGGANWSASSAVNNLQTYSVSQGIPNVLTWINNASANYTLTYPNTIEIRGNSTSGGVLPTFNLYVNNSTTGNNFLLSIGMPAFNSSIVLGNGTWQVIFNTSGNGNWSSSQNNTLFILVNKAALTGTLSTPTVTYPTSLSATSTISNTVGTDVAYRIYCGTTLVASATGSAPSGSFQFGSSSQNCLLNTTAGPFGNWTANSSIVTSTGTINKGILNGTITGANALYPNAVNVVPSESANSAGTDVNYTFWRNTSVNGGSLVSSATNANPSSDTTLLGVATYSWILNSTGGANWTANSSINISSFSVTQGSPSVPSITYNPTSPITYPTSDTATASVSSQNNLLSWTLYRDNTTTVGSGTSSISDSATIWGAGTKQYCVNTTGNTNYTSFVGVCSTLTINKAVPTLILSNNTASVNTSGLVGYWRFEEGSGTTASDSSGNGNNGTLTSSSMWTTGGEFGNGINFTGTNLQNISIASTSSSLSSNSTGLTVATWINAASWPQSASALSAGIVSDWNTFTVGSQKGYLLRVFNNTGCLIFTFNIADGINYNSTNSHCSDINTFYSTNTWIFVVGVYSANNYLKIYVNGVQSSSTTSNIASVMMPQTSKSLYIGYTGINAGYFNGTIDEVQIWNRSLTADEVRELYQSSAIYPNSTTFTGSNCPTTGAADVTYNLYRNTTSVSNPDTSTLGAGLSYYVYNTSGGQNYTINTMILPLNVTQGIPTVTTYLNNLTSSQSVTYPNTMEIRGNSSTTDSTGTLPTFNLYSNSSSQSILLSTGNPAFNSTLVLGGATWTIVYNTSGNANWTSSQNNTLTLTVNANSTNPITVTIQASNGTSYNNQNVSQNYNLTNEVVSGSNVITQSGSASVFVDGALQANPYNFNFNNATHSILINTTGNANYSANATGATYYFLIYKAWNQTNNTLAGQNYTYDKNTLGIPIFLAQQPRVQDTSQNSSVDGTVYAYIPVNSTNNASSYGVVRTNFSNVDVTLSSCPVGWTCPVSSVIVPWLNDSQSYVLNASMYQNNVITSVAGGNGDWTQDITSTTVAGGTAYIKGNVKASNGDTISYVNVTFAANNSNEYRSGWTCTQSAETISSISASGTYASSDYPTLCNKSNVITKSESGWVATNGTEQTLNQTWVNETVSGSNTDSVSYNGVSASISCRSGYACNETSWTFNVAGSNSWSRAINASNSSQILISQWSDYQNGPNYVQNPTYYQNITIDNTDSVTFYNLTAWTANLNETNMVAGNDYLYFWNGTAWDNITSSIIQTNCNTLTPTYSAITSAKNGTFYVCKGDLDSNGVVDYIKVKIPKTTPQNQNFVLQAGGSRNATLNVPESSISTLVSPGGSVTSNFTAQSVGDTSITNVNYSVSGGNLPASWVSFSPSPNITSISGGSSQSVMVNISVPAGTTNGNYWTNISVTTSNANSEWLWLNVSVEDWTINVSGGGPYANSGSNPTVTVTGNVSFINGTAISTPVNVTITSGVSTLNSQNVTSNSIGNFFVSYASGFAIGTYVATASASVSGTTLSSTSIFVIYSASGANCQKQTLSLSAIAYDAVTGSVISSGTAKLIIQETGDEKDVTFTNGAWSASFSTCLTTGGTYHVLSKIVDSSGRSSSSVLIFRAP